MRTILAAVILMVAGVAMGQVPTNFPTCTAKIVQTPGGQMFEIRWRNTGSFDYEVAMVNGTDRIVSQHVVAANVDYFPMPFRNNPPLPQQFYFTVVARNTRLGSITNLIILDPYH